MLLANGLVDKQADQNDPMIVAVILLREDGACLLQHRDDRPGLSAPGLWVFPGGHREKNENSLACLPNTSLGLGHSLQKRLLP